MTHSKLQQIQQCFLSLFIVINLCIIILWSIPSCTLTEFLFAPIKNISQFSGLWQNFAMFSPNPRNVNLNYVALITYADGSVKLWQFPRMEHLNIIDKMIKERYRKFINDHVSNESEKMIWPDVARHLAYINNSNPNNPPKVISLRSFISEIPDLETNNKRKETESYTFFVYKVMPEDLK
jgi:hypothetical protein